WLGSTKTRYERNYTCGMSAVDFRRYCTSALHPNRCNCRRGVCGGHIEFLTPASACTRHTRKHLTPLCRCIDRFLLPPQGEIRTRSPGSKLRRRKDGNGRNFH